MALKKHDLINIIKRVNMEHTFSSRHEQFTSVCAKFEIPCLPPLKLHSSSHMAGFFLDADGSVTLTVNRCRTTNPVLCLEIMENICDACLKDAFIVTSLYI
jgi:hypothetical protein